MHTHIYQYQYWYWCIDKMRRKTKWRLSVFGQLAQPQLFNLNCIAAKNKSADTDIYL